MSFLNFILAELVSPEAPPPPARQAGRIPATGRYQPDTPAEHIEADFADEVNLVMAPWLRNETGYRQLQPGVSYISPQLIEVQFSEEVNPFGIKGTIRQLEFTGLTLLGSDFDRVTFMRRHEKFRNPATLRLMETEISRIALISDAAAGNREDYIISRSVDTEYRGIRKDKKVEIRSATIADNTRGGNDCYYLRDFWKVRPDELSDIAYGIVKAEQIYIGDLNPLPSRTELEASSGRPQADPVPLDQVLPGHSDA